jgi:hypothetical protein
MNATDQELRFTIERAESSSVRAIFENRGDLAIEVRRISGDNPGDPVQLLVYADHQIVLERRIDPSNDAERRRFVRDVSDAVRSEIPEHLVSALVDGLHAQNDGIDQLMLTSDLWDEVSAVLWKHYHEPDTEGARALYAAVAAHDLGGQPVWPMIIAPPGSMKTELLNALEGLTGVHLIDKVTANTFISGQIAEPGKQKGEPSLLHRVGASAILIYPDFSTVLSMKRDDRGGVLADMRRIYDGHLRKEFGTSEEVRQWTGRITFVVAVTSQVDSHYAVFQTLGERFVMIRWHRPGGKEAALRAMNQDSVAIRSDLKRSVHKLFAALHHGEIDVSGSLQMQLAALAEIAVRARTQIGRDHSKQINSIPEPEAATRLAQQLCQLAKGSARLSGRCNVSSEDLALTRRVAFDCIPPARRAILEALAQGRNLGNLDLPGSTLSYSREDLESVGLLRGQELSGLAGSLLDDAGLLAA